MLLHQSLETGPLQVNCHILGDSDSGEAVIIDPGGDAELILALLERMKLRALHIVNTHGHFDHIGAVSALQKKLGCEFWLHAADHALVAGAAKHAARWGLPFGDLPVVHHELTDGQTLLLSRVEIDVLHTPGHTPGGVCLRWGDEMATGDTLFAGSVGRTDLPGGNHAQLIRSIEEKLMTLPDTVACHPGHGPSTTIGRERVGNQFLI
ncbi:MBL fold metallo-hydrolase [Magnetofaba australis]|uniref:Putative beta-lactamase domain-containing protein n=1 Tax=Magnetofaba australis IT-1 TaxID=1434232 RepID=A0A1Y2K5R1_9PROT|nr:MBL fold metallo-hydrolase [Magnetofaba australis]OSM04883.1 putative beta-lactamase domain-containing protein [Magnetofaba australis IT-1]